MRMTITYLLFVACSFSALTHASPVVLVEDNRWSSNIGQNCWEDEYGDYVCDPSFSHHYTPSADFADWNGNNQNSTVSTLLMVGSGSGDSYSDYGWYEQNVGFDVTFEVVNATEVWLTGSGDLYSEWGGGEIIARLTGPAGVLYDHYIWDFDALDFNDILPAGLYRLQVYTNVTPISSGSYNFDFSISPAVAGGNDADGDGVLDDDDFYPNISLDGRLDTDGDGIPNDCDSQCLLTGMTADTDDDGDGYIDGIDNCPLIPNPDQADSNGDGIGDLCQPPGCD